MESTWFRLLVASFSPRKTRFNPMSVDMGFVVDEVALGQVFLQELFCCQYHSASAAHSCSYKLHSYETDKRVMCGNLPTNRHSANTGEARSRQHNALL
jgi:hypothetical protein